MAERTGKRAVFALVLPELSNLGSMAGQAGIGDRFGEHDHFGSMGVLVAGETILEFEVGLILMALAALRNYFFNCRRMTDVTILARDIGFMFASLGFDIDRCFGMTLDAVSVS
jgi:hypothetical protein